MRVIFYRNFKDLDRQDLIEVAIQAATYTRHITRRNTDFWWSAYTMPEAELNKLVAKVEYFYTKIDWSFYP